ncbi:hypothetical protein Mal64_31890 [Pseudobythopirellula maris]|uniref:Uncharacterized protein n=1 Tax=Pseudobythopirellula maris TaxID=2527991 RepID=A0A5C5ZKS1_9BACT|nr:hypothetical protein [Pseudobythopirellula maris]TWT87647.1 hypothetical protein Mal64_31890 [Pseudobythopirellula maris]
MATTLPTPCSHAPQEKPASHVETFARTAVSDYAQAQGARDPVAIARFAVACVEAASRREGVSLASLPEEALDEAASRIITIAQKGTRLSPPAGASAPKFKRGRMPEQPLGELLEPMARVRESRVIGAFSSVLTLCLGKVGIGG